MTGRTQLHIALEEEMGIETIESLLAAGVDVNAMNEVGETALYYAVKNNIDLAVIKALLAAGSDVYSSVERNIEDDTDEVEDANVDDDLSSSGDVKNEDGFTPLVIAVIQGRDVEVVECLLAAGGDIYEDGETALYYAVKRSSDLRVIKALLTAGADIKSRDFRGNSLLHEASSVEIARELLSRGVSINEMNEDLETPLHIAVRRKREMELIEYLLAAGTDVNATDKFGRTVLYVAVDNDNNLGVIRALLSAGGDVNCRVNGNTLLHIVSCADVARELLSHGVDVNSLNELKETPLCSAIKIKRGLELIECLLAAGADVNSRNKCGLTSLYCAVLDDTYLEVIKALLMAGGDVNATNSSEETVLFSVVKFGIDLKVIEVLLTAGGDVNCRDCNGNSLLHVVLDVEAVKKFISLGLSVNAVNVKEETPLHIAVRQINEIKLIKSLLVAGADVNAANEFGRTALYDAVNNDNNLGVIKALLSAGGDINCRVEGNTLLHVVRSAGVARELLSRGVYVNETNNDQKTPLYYIAEKQAYFDVHVHELYVCMDISLQISQNVRGHSVCAGCRLKELVWSLILHGAAIRCDSNSPIDLLFRRNKILWPKFYLKAELIRSCFDGLEETMYLSAFKSYLSRLKTRKFLSDFHCREFSQFLDNAAAEIVCMKCDMLSDNLSIYNLFFKCEMDEKIFPLYSTYDDIEKEIFHKYPIYREILLPKIRVSVTRPTLINMLKGLTIYVKGSEKKEISLRSYILLEIADYLSNRDLAKLIKCVTSE